MKCFIGALDAEAGTHAVKNNRLSVTCFDSRRGIKMLNYGKLV